MPRSLPGPVTGCPSSSTSPELCSSKPARIRTRVDLPQPEGPTTHRNSRRWVMKLMSFSATVVLPSLSKFLCSFETVRMTSRAFRLSKRARTGADCSRYEGSRWLDMTMSFMVRTPSGKFGQRTIPREQVPSEQGEQHVGAQAEDADHRDRGVDVWEVLVARLLGNEPGDARGGTDEFGDDQVGPGPAEQNALIPIKVGQVGRHHHAREQLPTP